LIKLLFVLLVIFVVQSPVRKTNKYSMVLSSVIHFDPLGLTVTGMGALRSINRLFFPFKGDLWPPKSTTQPSDNPILTTKGTKDTKFSTGPSGRLLFVLFACFVVNGLPAGMREFRAAASLFFIL
jgi:hypothetical protein